MPKEIRIDREVMLDGAMDLIEESGFGAVSARSVAERLGISTQPIYREFGDMNGLKQAALGEGWRRFAEYVTGSAVERAVAYVMFAAERKNLYKFLFCDRNCRYGGLDEMAHKLVDDGIIDALAQITGLDREDTYRLHLYVWMALHGLAALSADNELTLARGEVEDFTVFLTRAVTQYIKSEKSA